MAALQGGRGPALTSDLAVPSVERSVLSYNLGEGPQIPGLEAKAD